MIIYLEVRLRFPCIHGLSMCSQSVALSLGAAVAMVIIIFPFFSANCYKDGYQHTDQQAMEGQGHGRTKRCNLAQFSGKMCTIEFYSAAVEQSGGP